MAQSGGLGCTDANDRMYAYYDMVDLPHLVWDGVIHQVGAGPDVADGEAYAATIAELLQVASPLLVSVQSYSFQADRAFVRIRLELFDDLASNAQTYLRVGICEDGLVYGGHTYDNILRDMPADTPLGISETGEVQEVTIPLTIGGQWDPDKLWLYAFVQRDTDKLVYNAASSWTAAYDLSVSVAGEQQAIVAGPHTFGETTITNTGAEDNSVEISLNKSSLPESWDAYFTLGGDDVSFATVDLEAAEAVALNVTIVPGDEYGTGRVTLNVHANDGEMADLDVTFASLTSGTDLLVVVDDAGAGYADDYYAPALATTGRSFAIWDYDLGSVTDVSLAPYEAVLWFCGDAGRSLDASDRDVVANYLDGGGNFLLCGQDAAHDIYIDGGNSWMRYVMHTAYTLPVWGDETVVGIDDDPISHGMALNLTGGDGADNLYRPDMLEPYDACADRTFIYDAETGAGVRTQCGGYKALFLGFGFESIDNAADRHTLVQRCLQWLTPAATAVAGDRPPQKTALFQNAPNPCNPQTVIGFYLARAGRVQLTVYDLNGRLVRRLVDDFRSAGAYSLVWDGRDSAGQQVASGTYVYRLDNAGEVFSRKMALLK
jgi:hypothetical protein